MNTIRTTTLTKAERNRLYIRYLLYGCPGVDAVYIQGKSWPWWRAGTGAIAPAFIKCAWISSREIKGVPEVH